MAREIRINSIFLASAASESSPDWFSNSNSSRSSSNSNRLRELAEKAGTPAYLIDGPADIDPAWLAGKTAIGVTAGASAPEVLVQQVIDRLRELGAATVAESAGRAENVVFSLPRELR